MNLFHRVLEERWLLYIGLFTLAIGLPLSRSLVSIGPGIIAGAWIFDAIYRKDLKNKLRAVTGSSAALALLSIFLIYVIWAIPSDNPSKAIKLAVDKLPLLVIPLCITGMRPIPSKAIDTLIRFHIGALLVSTLASTVHWFSGSMIGEARDSILFVNHIRLSLMLVLASIVMVLRPTVLKRTILIASIMIWFVCFILLFGLGTGAVLFSLLLLSVSLYWMMRKKQWRIPGAALFILLMILLGKGASIFKNQFDKPPFEKLEKFSAHGAPYLHITDNLQTENGNYVWQYIALDELKQSWNDRSSIQLGPDVTLEDLYLGRIIRYMSSKGLRKDREGVGRLSSEDIRRIEAGATSVMAGKHTGMYRRLQKIAYELDSYWYGGDPSLSSLTVRVEYWRTGLEIIRSNPWTGVGIGDVRDSFEASYRSGTRLKPHAWDKTHQQYLTWALTFGIPVGLIVLFLFLVPISSFRTDLLVIGIYAVFMISFFVEDTMENQLGLNLYLFYTALILLPRGYTESTRL